MSTTFPTIPTSKPGPAWEIATLFNNQGSISEGDYFWLTDRIRRLVEFTDGFIEVLPVPTTRHQAILTYLLILIKQFVDARQFGVVLPAGIRVQMRHGSYREPDLVFMKRENCQRIEDDCWIGADLVVEIVSEDDPNRDLVKKRTDYAEAAIPEYWIVDPRLNRITVLKLEAGQYLVHSEATQTGQVSGLILPDLVVDLAPVFAAGEIVK